MGFFDFAKTILETREMHALPDLRTHYYKTNFKKTKAVVVDYANQHDWSIPTVDDTHGELYLQAKNYHIIVSIVQVTPLETAVDFKVQFYSLMGFNRPKKQILAFYDYLDKNLPFKGTSLHP